MKKKILLIEDDMPTIDVYKTAFEQASFDVDPITSGQEAIRKVKEIAEDPKKKPDIILLDMILPDIIGIDVLKAIRENNKTKNIPVLILSNYTDKELEQKGLLLATEKYLLKTDHTPGDLIKIIKKELKG